MHAMYDGTWYQTSEVVDEKELIKTNNRQCVTKKIKPL